MKTVCCQISSQSRHSRLYTVFPKILTVIVRVAPGLLFHIKRKNNGNKYQYQHEEGTNCAGFRIKHRGKINILAKISSMYGQLQQTRLPTTQTLSAVILFVDIKYLYDADIIINEERNSNAIINTTIIQRDKGL